MISAIFGLMFFVQVELHTFGLRAGWRFFRVSSVHCSLRAMSASISAGISCIIAEGCLDLPGGKPMKGLLEEFLIAISSFCTGR